MCVSLPPCPPPDPDDDDARSSFDDDEDDSSDEQQGASTPPPASLVLRQLPASGLSSSSRRSRKSGPMAPLVAAGRDTDETATASDLREDEFFEAMEELEFASSVSISSPAQDHVVRGGGGVGVGRRRTMRLLPTTFRGDSSSQRSPLELCL